MRNFILFCFRAMSCNVMPFFYLNFFIILKTACLRKLVNDTMSLELKLRAFIFASNIIGSIPPTPCIKKEIKVVDDHMLV